MREKVYGRYRRWDSSEVNEGIERANRFMGMVKWVLGCNERETDVGMDMEDRFG